MCGRRNTEEPGKSVASADELIKNSENIRLALYNNFMYTAELLLHSMESLSPLRVHPGKESLIKKKYYTLLANGIV